MNKMLMYLTCVFGLLLACGLDVTTLIGYVTGAIIVVSVGRYLFMGELPEHFWLRLFGALFGPFFISSLIRAVCHAVWSRLVLTFGVFAPAPLTLAALLVSFFAFLYVRSEIRRLTGRDRRDDSLEERRPVLTLLQGRDDSPCEEEESESSNEYSDED